MPRLTNAGYADKHFVCGFCNGNCLAALREYQIDIGIGGNLSDVYLKGCIVMREKQARS
jgi:hypothetical protein